MIVLITEVPRLSKEGNNACKVLKLKIIFIMLIYKYTFMNVVDFYLIIIIINCLALCSLQNTFATDIPDLKDIVHKSAPIVFSFFPLY